jgi:hypothetical protein
MYKVRHGLKVSAMNRDGADFVLKRALKTSEDSRDLSLFGKSYAVREIFFSVFVSEVKARVPEKGSAQTKACLNFIENQRDVISSRKQAKRMVEALCAVSVSAFALSGLDDGCEVFFFFKSFI